MRTSTSVPFLKIRIQLLPHLVVLPTNSQKKAMREPHALGSTAYHTTKSRDFILNKQHVNKNHLRKNED